MQRNHLIPLAVSVLALAGTYSLSSPAVPGPGGVIDAVQDYLGALDRGDAKAIIAALDVQARGRDGMSFVPDPDKPGGFLQRPNATGPHYVDVKRDGSVISCKDRKQFLHVARRELGGALDEIASVTTRIHSIRANCPAPDASFAIVEFTRAYSAGKNSWSRRFIATAMLRHVAKKKAGGPDFRIFHWHASPAPVAKPLKKGG